MKILKVGFSLFLMFLAAGVILSEETVKVGTSVNALKAYENGFAYDVRRASGESVMLNDLEVIENDGAGAGNSEKGTFFEEIFRGARAKKVIYLDDPRASEAHVVIYLEPLAPDSPRQALPYILFNGRRIEGQPVPSWQGAWQYIPVPVRALKKGTNEIVIGCDAPRPEGFRLMISRADEYASGGGANTLQGSTALLSSGQYQVAGFLKKTEKNLLKIPGTREGLESFKRAGMIKPIDVGATSFNEAANGKWRKNRLGTSGDVTGEYVVRLALKRFKPEGSLLSPPIDLWDGVAGMDRIKPAFRVSDLKLRFAGSCAQGTGISWQIRFADTPDMMSRAWGEFADSSRGK